jgi:hypothetical protein
MTKSNKKKNHKSSAVKKESQAIWTKFQLVPSMTFQEAVTHVKEANILETYRKQTGREIDETDEEIIRQLAKNLVQAKTYVNNLYQVARRDPLPEETYDQVGFIHLSIKRHDKKPIVNWNHLQRIKNELVGPEYEAVELFPAESRLVNMANQYHLWVINDSRQRFPFGFDSGRHAGPGVENSVTTQHYEDNVQEQTETANE